MAKNLQKNKNKFTEVQQKVIDSRGFDMLVSASAGTGKTTVMIERIFQLIKNCEIDLSQVLVVTFTELAAADMKRKLTEKLISDGDSERISEQLDKIDSCRISTLHSFCANLLRNYFYVVGVDPAFAVIDERTAATLRADCLSEVFAEYYSSGDEGFDRLFSAVARGRNDDNLYSTVLKLYDFGENLVSFDNWYAEKRQEYLDADGEIFSRFQNEMERTFSRCEKTWDEVAQIGEKFGCSGFAALAEGNASFFRERDVKKCLAKLTEIKLPATPAANRRFFAKVKADGAVETMRSSYKTASDCTKDILKPFKENFAGKTLETLAKETASSVELTDKLAEVVGKFREKYGEAKARRGLIDFADMEHMTLQALSDQSVVAELKAKYKMVFVDEYQDINEVQENIISAISSDLFGVGDVKQSIYGFRGCDPTIFRNKLNKYSGKNGKTEVYALNENFRSDERILDFVNKVMCGAMTERFGKVDYENTAQLSGKRKYSGKYPPVLIDEKQAEITKEEAFDFYNVREESEKFDSEGRVAGAMIANHIKNLVGSTVTDENGKEFTLRYGDIAVLSRNMTDKASAVCDVLIENNVPVAANFNLEGIKNKEVRDLVNLLRVIDNPHSDVPLLGTLLSIFAFSEDDLAEVRIATKDQKCDFYDRVCRYVGENVGELKDRLANFLDYVRQLRVFSYGAEVSDVLLRVLETLNYHFYVQGMPNGSLRVRRMYKFIDDVKGKPYAQSVGKFVRFMDEQEGEKDSDAAVEANAVRMMTIHASKGLEFPVVILLGDWDVLKNDTENVARNFDCGIAMNYYDFDRMKSRTSVGRFVCRRQEVRKQKEEELRLLYVALTRAKCNLVLTFVNAEETGVFSDSEEAKNSSDWLLSAVKRCYSDSGAAKEQGVCFAEQLKFEEKSRDGLLCPQNEDLDSALKRINYRYPYLSQTAIPSKVASSMLDRDEETEYVYTLADEEKPKIGTAYHKVYETVDFDADEEAIARHIEELCRDEVIAATPDAHVVYKTLQNAQFRKLLGGKVYREIPFMLSADYSELAEGGEKGETVLQGVIDLLILDGDVARVVDFKYTSSSAGLEKRYAKQLYSYALAVRRITGIENVECYLFSLADNKLIKLQ